MMNTASGNLNARHRRWLTWLAIVLGTLTAQAGCGCYEFGYAVDAGFGHLDLLMRTVPIDEGLADETLTDEQRDKLGLIIRARDFARDEIGLNVGNSYQRFVNLHGEPLAFNLSASHRDAIRAYVWDLPFLGPISYLGYFELPKAESEADRLGDQGFDTFIYEIDAYSTLGLLPDPVTSALLERSVGSLVDTVIHELVHNTIWSRHVVFDESLAVFVGRTAALEFLARVYGADSERVTTTRANYEDYDRFNAFLADLRERVETVYNADLPAHEKIAQREPIFEDARARVATELLPTLNRPDRYATYADDAFNNAFLLVNGRYNTNLEVFQAIFDRVGGNWSEAMRIFADAAVTTDPFGHLRDVLAGAPTP